MILLDTHVVLWLGRESSRISRRATAAIISAANGAEPLGICDVSLLEITELVRKGRIVAVEGLAKLLDDIESRFVVQPITAKACALMASLPANYPKDPADRLIGATALAEGVPLITADSAIRRSRAVRTIW